MSYINLIRRCTLRTEISESPSSNALRDANLAERRLALRRKIERFRESQAVHMPTLTQHLGEDAIEFSNPTWQRCEQTPLCLPSSLDDETRAKVCSEQLTSVEDQLRFAHLGETLDDLRSNLRLRVFANQYKIKNVTGQRANTRTRNWQKGVDKRVLVSKRRYRRARGALYHLRGSGAWENTYHILKDDDVRAFNERALNLQEQREREDARRASGLIEEEVTAVPVENGLQTGEGRRHLSWIWLTQGGFNAQENDQAIHTGKYHVFLRMSASQATCPPALRVEWARSRARALRWLEEIGLLTEEMRRVIQCCVYYKSWWEARKTTRVDVEEELREGLTAYAHERMLAEDDLKDRWVAQWAPFYSRARTYLGWTDGADGGSDSPVVVEVAIPDVN